MAAASPRPDQPNPCAVQDTLLDSIVGFGEGSMRKSYYPELRRRLQELERFRTLFDAGNDLILLTELPLGIITDANLPACRRLGWPRDQLLGRPVTEVLEGGDLDALLADDATDRPAQLEMYFRGRDGSVFPVELTCRVAHAGAARSALIVARDITDRRCFECQLHAAKEKAERANMAKSKFLAAASHDLRQPAQALTLFTTVLRQKLTGHPASTVVEHLQNSVDSLRLLLDALLDVSRLDAGLVVPGIKAFPVADILSRLRAEYQMRAEKQNLRVSVVTSTLWLASDPILLERILRNLVENALCYTRSGGVVIGCRRHGGQVAIEVWDSGIGLMPEALDDIFEEFYQVDNPERDRCKGLGLGLAIVRRLSQLLSHEIGVTSTPGRGSRFSVLVPRADADPSRPVTAEPRPEPSCRGMSVLVIDADTTARASVRMMLESWGCRVRDAGSSVEAVKQTDLDVQFVVARDRQHDGSGADAIRAVQHVAGHSIPGLIIDGETTPERVSDTPAHGYRVLHGPVTAETLRAAICGQRNGRCLAADMTACCHRQEP